ncbi:MAG: ATP-dependent zinc metalloprotease FtsH [Patescibacteria group bacterium]
MKATKKPQSVKNILAKNIFGLVLIFLIIILAQDLFGTNDDSKEIALNQIVQDIQADKVARIQTTANTIDIEYTDGTKKTSKKEDQSSLTETLTNMGVNKEKLAAIPFEVKTESGAGYWLSAIFPFLLPILFFLAILWFFSRQSRGPSGAMAFGNSRARMMHPEGQKQKITFKDVAGAKEAKHELEEVVDFLKNPKKFLDIGARIPKGILLMGAPGTGKTLLARAVAGEANVSFFSISGSEFVELFVGVGASRVRDMFKVARASAPAIIFIDEIDAVGRVRGVGMGGGNDEREQTLNQILVEMDGFEPAEAVIVMAATNRPDVLDPALLRPGRFDRRVNVELPDRKDRVEILKVHAKNKPLAEDTRLETIAERTPGFSGADLHSLMNEAAILAAREGHTEVSQHDLVRSVEKVMLGPVRQTHALTVKEKELTAYHEAGHAIVSTILKHADPVHKISIISRGRALGYMLKLPGVERKTQSKNEFLDDIAVSLGGYVVEKTIFGDITTGPSNDLQVASAMARDMVTKYGMSDEIGAMALLPGGGKTMFGNGVEDNAFSEKTGELIDSEVSKIMKHAYERALKIIEEKRSALDAVAKALVEFETLEQAEYEAILVKEGIEIIK